MTEQERKGFTRRQAIAAGAAGAAGAATLPAVFSETGSGQEPEAEQVFGPRPGATARMPVAFVPHGGGPWPWVDLGVDPRELEELTVYLESLRGLPKTPPKALLVISAHWEEPVPTVMTSPQPPMLYDYYGFPPDSYRITWPARGEPRIAARVRELLGTAGIASAENATRGFDHGTFVPFKLTYPTAEVPTLQLSLKAGLDPDEHLAIGRALAPLRDEGVFILGSGMTYHDLRGFRDPRNAAVAEEFDAWLREAATREPGERARRLSAWATAPQARRAHPREEHLLPLMVVAGAAGADVGTVAYNGAFFGMRLSAYHFG
ncbi:MAG TPA: class III extradiol ring-cleavage dioxygenase [Polyangiaceae bacterium]